MFERLGTLLGPGAWAEPMIVVVTAALFGLAHYPEQRAAGVQQATIVGLLFGSIFALTGRIWMPTVAHAAFDVTSLAIIYWDIESQVAHAVSR